MKKVAFFLLDLILIVLGVCIGIVLIKVINSPGFKGEMVVGFILVWILAIGLFGKGIGLIINSIEDKSRTGYDRH